MSSNTVASARDDAIVIRIYLFSPIGLCVVRCGFQVFGADKCANGCEELTYKLRTIVHEDARRDIVLYIPEVKQDNCHF